MNTNNRMNKTKKTTIIMENLRDEFEKIAKTDIFEVAKDSNNFIGNPFKIDYSKTRYRETNQPSCTARRDRNWLINNQKKTKTGSH